MKKFGGEEQPVVMDKPSHHTREVESVEVMGDEGGYYKAFDGEKMVLVPKANLEAMKELVNIKMRRRADSKFAPAPDPTREEKQQKLFEAKIEHLKHNIEEYEETTLEPLMAQLMAESKPSRVEEEIVHQFRKSEIASSFRKTEPSIKSLPLEIQDEPSEKASLRSKSLSEEVCLLGGSIFAEAKSIKFVISGHFRNNKKPVFIIRQYRGSSIIGKNFSDFNSIKTDKGVDILISGKFYKDSILKEKDNKPNNIKFKPRKKILVDSRTNIIEDGFIELFSMNEFDVVVGGMFVKQHKPDLPHYTPLVSIAIRRLKQPKSRGVGFFSFEKKETIMSASTPAVQNPFVQELRQTHSESTSRSRRRMTVSSATQEPQGFKSLLTRIDEGEEAFECPPSQKARSRESSLSSTSTQNSVIQKIKKPRVNFTFNVFRIRKESNKENGGSKSLATKSTQETPLQQIQPRMKKDEEINLPSTSEDKRNVRTDPYLPQTQSKSKPSKKPGFFKRLFKRLFTRR